MLHPNGKRQEIYSCVEAALLSYSSAAEDESDARYVSFQLYFLTFPYLMLIAFVGVAVKITCIRDQVPVHCQLVLHLGCLWLFAV